MLQQNSTYKNVVENWSSLSHDSMDFLLRANHKKKDTIGTVHEHRHFAFSEWYHNIGIKEKFWKGVKR